MNLELDQRSSSGSLTISGPDFGPVLKGSGLDLSSGLDQGIATYETNRMMPASLLRYNGQETGLCHHIWAGFPSVQPSIMEDGQDHC
jgi:hypothetical protein